MSTILPFVHGMNRHLDSILATIRKDGRRGLLVYFLVDFGFFIAESCFFFALATTINANPLFFRNLLGLLVTDILWRAITFPVSRNISAKWIVINLAVSSVIVAVIWWGGGLPAALCVWLLAIAAMLRTVMDYFFGWSFYFPPDDPASTLAAATACGFQEWMERNGKPEPVV
jgi:hypothetical protein